MGVYKKHENLKELFELGLITTFDQFVEHISYSTLAKNIGISKVRMKKLLTRDTGDMTFGELTKIAKVLAIKRELLFDLAIKKIEV